MGENCWATEQSRVCLYTGQTNATQPKALAQMSANKHMTDSHSQPFHMFQKAFPGKLKPALSGTHRYSLSVRKTAAAFILHLALAEWLSSDISSCLLLWIDKDVQICRDITGTLILGFSPLKCFSLCFCSVFSLEIWISFRRVIL